MTVKAGDGKKLPARIAGRAAARIAFACIKSSPRAKAEHIPGHAPGYRTLEWAFSAKFAFLASRSWRTGKVRYRRATTLHNCNECRYLLIPSKTGRHILLLDASDRTTAPILQPGDFGQLNGTTIAGW